MRQDISQIQLRIPVQTHLALKAEAQRQERSVNWLIGRLLERSLSELAKKGVQP